MSDIIAALQHDHAQICAQLTALIANEVDADDRAETFSDIVAEMRIHADFEEEQVYPLIIASGAASAELAEQAPDDHDEIAGLAEEIGGLDVDDEGWFERVQEIHTVIRRHIGVEERILFPALRKLLAADELVQLGRRYEDTKPGVV